MKTDPQPIDAFKNPVEDLELAKRLHAPGDSKEEVALEREGLGEPNAGRKRSRVSPLARPRTIVLVAVVIVAFVLVVSIVSGLL